MICESVDRYIKLALAQAESELANAAKDAVDSSLPVQLQTEALQRQTELTTLRNGILDLYGLV